MFRRKKKSKPNDTSTRRETARVQMSSTALREAILACTARSDTADPLFSEVSIGATLVYAVSDDNEAGALYADERGVEDDVDDDEYGASRSYSSVRSSCLTLMGPDGYAVSRSFSSAGFSSLTRIGVSVIRKSLSGSRSVSRFGDEEEEEDGSDWDSFE